MKRKHDGPMPKLLILNQMAGPMTWELAEDAADILGCVALFTGHPDTLKKSHTGVLIFPAMPYQRGNFPRRALSWLRYAWQAFWWLRKWPNDIPVLLFSNPPILVWVGGLLKLIHGLRYSVMVHDIYPDVLARLAGYSERHPLIVGWRWLNRRAYENAERVMTLDPYMVANLEKHFVSSKTPAGYVEIINPWVDTDVIRPIPKNENRFVQQHGLADKLTVMYSGNMGLGHDIESILKASVALKDVSDIHFMFIGSGPKWQEIQKTMEREQLTNVSLLEWQPEYQLPHQLAAADVGLVSLEAELWDLAIPSKALYMMAAGCALVALAPRPSTLSNLVESSSAGVVLPLGDNQAIEKQLDLFLRVELQLLSRRMAARHWIVSGHARHTTTHALISLLQVNKDKNCPHEFHT